MLVHGELETTERLSKCFSLLIKGEFCAMEPILRTFLLFFGCNLNLRVMKHQGLVVFTGDPPRDSGPAFGFDCPLFVGVMFFPSFPFVGVMLFPSFVLGNASGEGGTFFGSLFPFSPLLSSPSPSFLVSPPLFPSLFLTLEVFFFLGNCLYCLFPRCMK